MAITPLFDNTQQNEGGSVQPLFGAPQNQLGTLPKPGLFGQNGSLVGGTAGQYLSNVGNAIKGNVNEATNSDVAFGEGKMGLLQSGANIAKNATEAVLQPLNQAIKPVMDRTISPLIDKTANKISDSPIVQKTAQIYNPNAVKTVGDIVQTGVNVGTLGTIEGAPSEIKTKISDTANALKEKVTTNPTEKFNSNVNKALPVLKNDVKTLPIKQANVRTALGDIVANKESIGLTDANGQPRVPQNFIETVQAQTSRMKQIYSDYSAKLSTVDKMKFQNDIHEGIFKQMDSVKNQLAKENSLDGRRALTKIQSELGSLRDTSPEGIQKYIEDINQRTKTAPGAPLSTEQIKLANLGGDMRKILDTSIEKINGKGYQDLRNVYGAHRAIESQLLMAAKKEINNVPGLSQKLSSAGATIEGINFLLTHNPKALIASAGIKGISMLTKYLNSPTTALGKLFKQLENESQIRPKS